jgi:hypothetical protein
MERAADALLLSRVMSILRAVPVGQRRDTATERRIMQESGEEKKEKRLWKRYADQCAG